MEKIYIFWSQSASQGSLNKKFPKPSKINGPTKKEELASRQREVAKNERLRKLQARRKGPVANFDLWGDAGK